MKKILRKIHLWIALPIGLILTVVCLTGAILVFKTEIEEKLYPKRYFVEESADSKLPLEKLMVWVNEQLENDVATAITVSSDPERTYSVSVASDFHRVHYVNPYTGKLILTGESSSFFMKMMQLHRWLLLDRKVGKPITGWSTLLFVIVLITGSIIVMPKTKKGFKRLYVIHLNKGWKRFWYDLHRSAGTHFLWILLLSALTGLTWSFRWYNNGVYKLLGVELPAMNPHAPRHQGKGERQRQQPPETDFTHWQSVLEKIQEKNPDYRTIFLRNESVMLTQKRFWGNVRATDRYTFDAATGEITDYQPYARQEKAGKIRGWLYTLHVGAWGGWFSKIITCLASVIGACLPLTGYYIFWKKRKKQRLPAK